MIKESEEKEEEVAKMVADEKPVLVGKHEQSTEKPVLMGQHEHFTEKPVLVGQHENCTEKNKMIKEIPKMENSQRVAKIVSDDNWTEIGSVENENSDLPSVDVLRPRDDPLWDSAD